MRPQLPVFLAFCLLFGSGFTHAQSGAINAPRLFELGMNAYTGIGPGRNEREALDLFRRSADLGYPPAETVMGYLSETGTIVPKEPQQAVDWYKKAAQQGDVVGAWLVGQTYFAGTGVPRDLTQAATWLQRAASQGNPFAQYLLGQIKAERNDFTGTADLFRKAAMQGLPQAQQQLGLLLENGHGTDPDKYDAYIWLLLSSPSSNAPVADHMAQLEAALGTAKVGQAKIESRDRQAVTARVVVAKGCTGWQGEFDAVPAPPPPEIQNSCR
jgi:TPR repeat protein